VTTGESEALGAAFASFVPIDRLRALASGETLPDRARGAALMGDLSSFTPLAVELRKSLAAKRAAEEITRHLNAIFTPIIDITHRFGGSVINFAGDALTCWFDADDGTRATAAALAMEKSVAEVRPVELPGGRQLSVGIRIAVVAGDVRRFLLGDPRLQCIDTLAGSLLDRLDAGLRAAANGEVLVGDEVAAALGGDLDVVERRASAGGERFVSVGGLRRDVAARTGLDLPRVPAAQLRPWVPPQIATRLATGGDSLLAEVRPVVAMFIRFDGGQFDDDQSDGKRFDDYVRFVQRAVAELEGDVVELTVGDKGSSLYVVFGATVAHEDDPLRAVRAAIALRTPPADIMVGHQPQIGISTGEMRVGTYGSSVRRGYGVQGQEVNVAARLMMAAAPGDILVSQRVADAVARRVEAAPVGELALKGIDRPVQACRIVRERDDAAPALLKQGGPPLVGRATERAAMVAALDRAVTGVSEVVLIEGPAGIGKSRLLGEVLSLAQDRGVAVWGGAAEEIERRRPYNVWTQVARAALGITAGVQGAHAQARVLEQLAGVPDAEAALPLLNALLPLQATETSLTMSLTGKLRADRTADLLLAALQQARAARPMVIVLEDAHWMDALSVALVAAARERMPQLLIALTSRDLHGNAELEAIADHSRTTHLRLGSLELAETGALAAWRLGVRALPDELTKYIHATAGGQPFFTEELTLALRDAGLVRVVDGTCQLTTTRRLNELDFPGTLQGVVTSRLDRLEAPQQLVLKVASVIGRTFDVAALEHAYPDTADRNRVRSDLEALSLADITPTASREPELTYMFRHALMRDVVYRRLLSSQRRDLHQAVGAWYEHAHADDLGRYYTVLAYHWREVASIDSADVAARSKALDYLRKAAGQTTHIGMPKDAVAFGLDAVRLLGMDIPADSAAIGAAIGAGEGALQEELAGRDPMALLGLRPMTAESPARIIETLLEIMPAAFMAQMGEVFALAAITNLQLTLEHGNAPATPVAHSMYAILRRNAFQDIQGAHAFSRLALALDEQQGGYCFGVCAFIHTWFIDMWLHPLRQSIPLSLRAGQTALERGDVLYGCFNLSGHVLYSAGAGLELATVERVAREQRDVIARRVLSSTFHCVIELQFAKALAGRTRDRLSLTDDEHDELADLASICDTDQYNQMAYYHVARLKLHVYHRDFDEALLAADRGFALLTACGGQVAEVELRFFFIMAAAGAWDHSSPPRRQELLARAEEQAGIIRGWRAHCEANFGHLSDLADGELARLRGLDDDATRSFARAAAGAAANEYLQYAALAIEVLARHHKRHGRAEQARATFDAAEAAYRRWGASLKAQDVRTQRP
jgi:class 3 adenylate cyclase